MTVPAGVFKINKHPDQVLNYQYRVIVAGHAHGIDEQVAKAEKARPARRPPQGPGMDAIRGTSQPAQPLAMASAPLPGSPDRLPHVSTTWQPEVIEHLTIAFVPPSPHRLVISSSHWPSGAAAITIQAGAHTITAETPPPPPPPPSLPPAWKAD